MRKSQRKKNVQRQSAKSGMAPGTPVFIGEQKQDTVRIDIIHYGPDFCDNVFDTDIEHGVVPAREQSVTWINCTGIHDVRVIQDISNRFGLHPLTVEDIVNTNQRPKAEVFPNYIYIVLKMMKYHEDSDTVLLEHVSLILGKNYVLSFQETAGDVFDGVRERIRTSKGKIRAMQADYLAYTLMDAVVDQYFFVVERLGDCIEEIDDRLIHVSVSQDLQEIHRLKRNIVFLRKAVWPMREEINTLEKSETSLIQQETRVYLRDLYDHTIQVIDMVETFRDLLAGVHDTYLSAVSNRMNEVMKILTIISTLFIPLTFIAGIYGMNFEHMPELTWKWGYFAVLGVMTSMTVGMLLFFRRKKWI